MHQVLTAWAVTGPNDQEGQTRLAEALRIDPSAAVAKAAFERMEGIAGEHGELEAAIAKYSAAELTKIEAEIKKPSFRRAQVGFNNNMKFRDQGLPRADRGLGARDKPHIITHLFADGGRVIKYATSSTYARARSRAPTSAPFVRALMKQQHMEMVLMLREGKFDDILAGKRIGGMDTLTEPPNADVRKLTKGKKDTGEFAGPAEQIRRAVFKVAEPAAPSLAVAAAAPPTPVSVNPRPSKPRVAAPAVRERLICFTLQVIRALWGAPDSFAPPGDEVVIGRANAGVLLEGERFCHEREAIVRWRAGKLWLEDFEGGSGVFLRIKTPVELEIGDEFVLGDQLARIPEDPVPDVGPGPGPTYFLLLAHVALVVPGGADLRGGARRKPAWLPAGGTTVRRRAKRGRSLCFANDPAGGRATLHRRGAGGDDRSR